MSKEAKHLANTGSGKKHISRNIILAVLAVTLLIVGGAAVFINSKLDKMNLKEKVSKDNIVIKDGVVTNISDEDALDTSGMEEREGASAAAVGEITEDNKYLNIMLIGTDLRLDDVEDLGRADCTMLVSLNLQNGAIRMISFERMLGVHVPGYEEDDAIAYLMNYGGCDLICSVVEDTFLVDIDAYVHVDFDSFVEVIDAIGGVDVTLTEIEALALNGEYRTNAWAKHKMYEGLNHLDGYDALCYARERYCDDNYGRVQRQRNLIEAIAKQMTKLSLSELNAVADKVLPLVDTNLSKTEITRVIFNITKFINMDIQQTTIPHKKEYWYYHGGNQRSHGLRGCDYQIAADEIHEMIYGKE